MIRHFILRLISELCNRSERRMNNSCNFMNTEAQAFKSTGVAALSFHPWQLQFYFRKYHIFSKSRWMKIRNLTESSNDSPFHQKLRHENRQRNEFIRHGFSGICFDMVFLFTGRMCCLSGLQKRRHIQRQIYNAVIFLKTLCMQDIRDICLLSVLCTEFPKRR